MLLGLFEMPCVVFCGTQAFNQRQHGLELELVMHTGCSANVSCVMKVCIHTKQDLEHFHEPMYS